VGSSDKTLYKFQGGHIGVFVGSRSQKELAPAIAKWMIERDAPAKAAAPTAATEPVQEVIPVASATPAAPAKPATKASPAKPAATKPAKSS
jgi:hypothetical protein